MVQLTLRLSATSGHGHQLVEALQTLMRRTRGQPGFSDAHIAADVNEAHCYWYVENWETAETLEGEFRRDRFSQLLALMETSALPPLLEFRVITETRGLSYVADVRSREAM